MKNENNAEYLIKIISEDVLTQPSKQIHNCRRKWEFKVFAVPATSLRKIYAHVPFNINH